jgi:hypothetical protein
VRLIDFAFGLLAIALVGVSCIPAFGDPTKEVFIENRTDVPLVIYTFDRDPRFKEELAPGQTLRDTWRYPLSSSDRRRVRVEADDKVGTRIFCADYSYEDLANAKWRIEVTRALRCADQR